MEDNYKHKGLRKKLIADIQSKIGDKIDSKVFEAMNKVPRHLFIDSSFFEYAYLDRPFSIGYDQTISTPSTVAKQTNLLNVIPGNKVLEIGTGSGYQAAVLNEMGAKVFTIERQRELFIKTSAFLSKKYPKIKCFFNDGYRGLSIFQPFDRIIVTAAAPLVPADLLNQLAIDGIMVIPVTDNGREVMTVYVKKSATEFDVTKHDEDFCFVPMLESVNI